MKDYESYRNNGNKDIPDNPKLKKNEFYNRQFYDNELPGEYFDIRENALDCEIDDDDNYAYNASEKGSADTKDLDDIQELTNVVNSTTQASIVESAGAIATGTATVVVGAAAAVVAFNATNKVQPTMKVNQLDSGSSFVHYNLEIKNLDLEKDYDIVIRNGQQEFKIDCANGINDEYVYNLKPGLQYSLSLVGYNELLGEIPYVTKNFYTLSTDETLGYSNIKIIYNDDLTCGIEYDTTFVDDLNTMGDTYIVIKQLVEGQGDEEWDLFNSLYAEDYMREEPDKYTYSYSKKVHKGSISEVYPGLLIIELHLMSTDEETDEGELICRTEKEIVFPLYEKSDTNYIEFIGDYDLIKDVKKINVKNDNLVAKVSLYNDSNELTFIEKEIDITNRSFDYKQLVKQDTTAYSYQIGYYKADKKFVVIKEIEKQEHYGGYYGAYYEQVFDAKEYEKFNIKWKYDSEDNETMDLTVLTGFDNYGNDDCYYKVDLLRETYHPDGDPTYEIVDTYIGTENPTFYDVPTYIYNEEFEETSLASYRFKYTSLMNYYDEEKGIVQVVIDTYEDDWYTNTFQEDLWISGSLIFRGDGLFETTIDMEYEMGPMLVGDFVTATATVYFFKDDYNVITDTLTVEGTDVAQWLGNYAYLIFDKEFPTDVVGTYISYEIYYRELHGNNIRRAKSKEKVLQGDLQHDIEASLEEVTIHNTYTSGKIELSAYIPEGTTVKSKVGYSGDLVNVPKVGNKYIYTFDELAFGETVYIDAYYSNGQEATSYAYTFYSSDSMYEYDDGYVSYHRDDSNEHIVFTYNDDGTINVYCDTGLSKNEENMYNQTDYMLDCYLDVNDINYGNLYSNSVKGITEDNTLAVFEKIKFYGSPTELTFRYDLTVDSVEEYLACHKIKKYTGSEFLMTESNINSMHPAGQLMGYVSYNDEYDRDVISLLIPSGMIYDKDQEVEFVGYFDPNEEPTRIKVKLSDYLVSNTDDGDNYIFDIDSSYIVGGTLELHMMYNYTLTEDRYDAIKDVYIGNLYKEYTVNITHM